VAFQAVVDREKIKNFLRNVTKQKGKFYLAMLVQTSPELPQRWSLVVSAPWIDASGLHSAVSYLSSQLSANLDKNSLSVIDRISPIATTQPIIENVGRPRLVLDDPGGPRIMRNWQIGDWFIPYGYLFVADPNPHHSPAQPIKNWARG
jgi:hypothetical protein